MQEQSETPTGQPASEEVVYGDVDGSLVFAKRSDANQLCACHKALWTAKTWGQFRSAVGQDAYDELIEFMGSYFEGTITDFTTFYEELHARRPDATPEQAREEYVKLPVGEPPLSRRR